MDGSTKDQGAGHGPGAGEIPRSTRAYLLRLSPQEVVADQRRRILAASREAIWRRGYPDTAVRHVLDLAGVSRKTFYELYSDRHEAARAAHAEALADLDRCLAEVGEAGERWARGVRGGLDALLAWAAADPPRTNLLLAEFPASSSESLALRDALLGRFAPFLRRGRRSGAPGLPDLLEEGLVGGLSELIAARLRSDPASLPDLAPELARLVLCVYGRCAAGGETD